EYIAEVLEILESTVGQVICEWNKNKAGKFITYKLIGQPLLKHNPDIISLLYKKITSANKNRSPISTPVLHHFLAKN
ncbi:10381_t:CDS:1, partial [Dentiscutata heterogama]